MITKIRESLQKINWKLYTALMFMGLCPAIYTAARTHFLGQMPGEWAYSIAGQLSWVSLIYEVINEAIILPLFYFLGQSRNSRKEFDNRIRTGLYLSVMIYSVLAIGICIFIQPMLRLMAASPDIIGQSAQYIRLESAANTFWIMLEYASVALMVLGKEKAVYALTGAKLAMCLLLDTFLVSSLPVSLNLGVNGIGVSNLLANAVLFGAAVLLLKKEGCLSEERSRLDFAWAKEFARIGGISGLESFVRNLAYIVMVSRMVNVVGEQGTYWVANNFIWGWLLLPVTQLGELIKQEVSTDRNAIKNNTLGYFTLTGIVVLAWITLIPSYRPFMTHVLGYADSEKVFSLVMLLLAFYAMYAFQNIFDATFYGAGRTDLLLLESVLTNTLYYGTAFILYRAHIWTPTLYGIALLFGIGNAFDAVVSGLVYRHFIKQSCITRNTLNIQKYSSGNH